MAARLTKIFSILILLSFLTLNAVEKTDPPPETPDSGNTVTQIGETLSKTKPEIKWEVSTGKIIWSVLFFMIGLLLIRYATKILEAIAERWSRSRLFIKRTIPIIRILGWTTVIYLIIVGVLAPPVETIIAVTASTGIALGFASQDILKNVFGGIMILFDHPFQIGDKITVGQHYGEVVQIGLRSVRIVTPDDSLVSIPNSEIVNQSVSNANSGEFNCQVVCDFFLPTNIDIEQIKELAYRAVAVSRYVYLKKPVTVLVKNEIHEGNTVLKLRTKAYVLDLRFEFKFMSEITETFISELNKKNIPVLKNPKVYNV